MGLMHPSMLGRLQEFRPEFYPVLSVTWPTGVKHYAGAGVTNAIGEIFPCVVEGGWGNIRMGVSERPSSLSSIEAEVTVQDAPDGLGNRLFLPLLEGSRNPRKSPAVIRWAVPDLDSSLWYTLFTGVLDTWSQPDPMQWKLRLRTDETAIRGYVPRDAVTKGAFPGAPNTSLGIYFPWVYGIHDSSSLTGQGMVPTVPVSISATYGYKYLVSAGVCKSVPRVYKNGSLLGAVYAIEYPIVGGRQVTIVKITSGTTVEADEISCDVEGLTSDGTTSGGVILSPIEQLKHALVNQVFGSWKQGAWLSDSGAPIDTGSFARAATFAQNQRYEGSWRFGGDREPVRASDLIDEWLKSHPMTRLYWMNTGKLACKFLSFVHPGYLSWPWVNGDQHEVGSSFSYKSDSGQSINQVSMSYLHGARDDTYFATIDLQDLFSQERVTENLPLKNSAARFI